MLASVAALTVDAGVLGVGAEQRQWTVGGEGAMTYGVIVRVPAPIEAYDASHAAIVEAVGDRRIPGFILHAARATDDGFEIIEVWESREHYQTFNRDVVGPAMAGAGMTDLRMPPAPEEFHPRAVMAVSYAS